jgi:hypothetical protein
LQTFEEIFAVCDDPVWLWPAYYNIGQIYLNWRKTAIAEMYHGKSSEIRDSGDLAARLADAIIKTEIEMEAQKP